MLEALRNIFSVPELRKRILFTAALLVVYRIGSHVPTPGVDSAALNEFFRQQGGTLLAFYDLFSGGALRRLTIFALGIMPYISASIVLQLLTVVWPYLEKLSKEGEAGRKKITQYTRYGTVVLSAIQGLGIGIGLEALKSPTGAAIIPDPGWSFRLMTMLTLTAGTAFIMWLGEQISERGIGNGISLIIFAGIVVRMPEAIISTFQQVSAGTTSVFTLGGLMILMVLVTAGVVVMTVAQRKIKVEYAKRVVGRKVYGGQSTHLPLRVNTAGVIPVIFASSLIMFPATIFRFLKYDWAQTATSMLSPGAWIYNIIYVVLIIFFTFFYTAIIFNPNDVADNMKKYGGFIPGIRPGAKTAEFIDKTLTRLTFVGALYLALISVLPEALIFWMKVPFYFGGTALMIVVGVALDTVAQVESHLIMRHYEGFMKKGKIRSRV